MYCALKLRARSVTFGFFFTVFSKAVLSEKLGLVAVPKVAA